MNQAKLIRLKAESVYDATFYERAKRELDSRASEHGLPTLDEVMWRGVKHRLRVPEFSRVPWGQCRYEAREMGFPLNYAEQEQLNRWLALPRSETGAPTPTPPIPEAQATASNCAMCRGTGRTEEGSYCTCVTGRDLARVESPVEKSDADEEWDSLPSAE